MKGYHWNVAVKSEAQASKVSAELTVQKNVNVPQHIFIRLQSLSACSLEIIGFLLITEVLHDTAIMIDNFPNEQMHAQFIRASNTVGLFPYELMLPKSMNKNNSIVCTTLWINFTTTAGKYLFLHDRNNLRKFCSKRSCSS